MIICRADGVATEHDGRYLSRYDPTVHKPSGEYDGGILETTTDPKKALQFLDMHDALELWKLTPGCACHGTRPWDGKPNRPLTMFTVQVVEIGDNRLRGDGRQNPVDGLRNLRDNGGGKGSAI